MRSGKHGCSAWDYFIIVTPRGRIVYISNLEGGSKNDKTHFNETDAVSMLQDKYGRSSTVKIGRKLYHFTLCGDKAYPYTSAPDGWRWYITKTGEHTLGDETDGENRGKKAKHANLNTTFDEAIAKYRGVVERTIRLIKAFKIMHGSTLMQKQERARRVTHLVAAIVNWFIIKNNVEQVYVRLSVQARFFQSES